MKQRHRWDPVGARVLAEEEQVHLHLHPRPAVARGEDPRGRVEFSSPLVWERHLDLLTPILTARSVAFLISFFPLLRILLKLKFAYSGC